LIVCSISIFLAEIWIGFTVVNSIFYAFGNCAEVLIAATIMKRKNEPGNFLRETDQLKNFLIAIIAGSCVAGVIGTTVTTLSNSEINPVHVFLSWIVSDSIGHLLIVPILMTISDRKFHLNRDLIGLVLYTVTIGLSVFFAFQSSSVFQTMLYLLLPFPLLTRCAIVYGLQGAAVSSFMVCVTLITQSVLFPHPIFDLSQAESAIMLQMICFVISITFISLAIVQQNLKENIERLDVLGKKAVSEVETLTGLLPICSNCKNIRNDKGEWLEIETYIQDHSEALFSHGICPDCTRKLYPDID
jgi:integral membrane sensor domain MASE1